jgi:hypothetical protein
LALKGDAVAGDRRLDLGKGGVEGQLPVDPDAKLLPLSPELPGIQAAVLLHALTQAAPGVEAVLDDVAQAVVAAELDLSG